MIQFCPNLNVVVMILMFAVGTDPYWDNVAWAIDDWQTCIQQKLSHVFDIPLVRSAQSLTL